MTKQIINSHKLIHVVSKDLERVEGCSRHMHKICKGLYYCQRPYLEARQCYKVNIIGEPSLVIQGNWKKFK